MKIHYWTATFPHKRRTTYLRVYASNGSITRSLHFSAEHKINEPAVMVSFSRFHNDGQWTIIKRVLVHSIEQGTAGEVILNGMQEQRQEKQEEVKLGNKVSG